MSTSQTLALIGFPPNEMSAFKALFRLAARSGTGYVMVEQTQAAQIILANADDAETVRRLWNSQPRARVLLIGSSDHGTGWLVQRRPIQLLTVLDAVRALGGSGVSAPPPVAAPAHAPAGFAPTVPFEISTQSADTTRGAPLDDEPSSLSPGFAATEPFAPLEMPAAAPAPDSAAFAATEPYVSGFAPTQPYTGGFPATEPVAAGGDDLEALRAIFAKAMPSAAEAIDPESIALWREARRVNSPAASPAMPAPAPAAEALPSAARAIPARPDAVPAHADRHLHAIPELSSAAEPRNGDVLVVDAGDNSRRTLERYLHDHGFRANLVRSGAEAADQLATHSYRLVFVNEPVAGTNVFRVCRAVRRQANADGTHPTVVMVLSSRRGWWDRWRARLAGCDVCLVRPFDASVLGGVLMRFAAAASSA